MLWNLLLLFVFSKKSKSYLLQAGAKNIKKKINLTQNKSQTHRARAYEVTSFLSTDCKLRTETCSKNIYSPGPCSQKISSLFSEWLRLPTLVRVAKLVKLRGDLHIAMGHLTLWPYLPLASDGT